MREVDWTIVPSTWWENAPVVIQEAFHHGRPIIASDIGGMAEKVRDGIDGLHFHAGNPESLAEAMTRAIREPALWDRLHAGIRPPTTAGDAARQHAALFERLIARSGAQPRQPAARRSRPERDGRAPAPEPRSIRDAMRDLATAAPAPPPVVGFFVNLLHLALPLYTNQIYDRVISSGSMDTLSR